MHRLKKYKRIMSILLIISMLFSFAPLILATENDGGKQSSGGINDDAMYQADLKELMGDVVGSTHITSYYTGSADAKEQSASFLEFPVLGTKEQVTSTKEHGFLYDGAKLQYYDGKQCYDIDVKVQIGDKTYSSSEIYETTGTGMKSGRAYPLDVVEYDADSYVGQDITMMVTVLDENGQATTESSEKKVIGEGDYSEKNISKAEESAFKKFLKALSAPVTYALQLLENILCGLFLSVGDGILIMFSNVIGQIVDIETVIFDGVEKLSINFWGGLGNKSVGSMMSGVVTTWYSMFRNIATLVYIAVLLVIGINISMSSTGAGNAKYKMLLKEWFIGVAILFLFPYAMSLMADMNETLVKAIGRGAGFAGASPSQAALDKLNSSYGLFGNDEFVAAIQEAKGRPKIPTTDDGFMYIRYLAGQQKRIPLTIVYLIMLFQCLVIIFVYYKRVFMVAFLVTIFPIVAVSYILDKLRWRSYKNECFWKLA